MPRLFTGLKIPAEIATGLESMQGGIEGARWIDREDFHLTLSFIGDVGHRDAAEISQALEETKSASFELSLSGVDIFGGKKPHSMFAGVSASDQLVRLKEKQDRYLSRIGLQPDRRKFTPHVTLARLKNASLQSIVGFLSRHGGYRSPAFRVNGFFLFSARESIGGGPYLVEEQYEFA